MPADESQPSGFRRALLAAAALATLAAGGLALQNLFLANRPPPVDFAAFWAAGNLVVRGENPYDPVAIRARQREIGGLNADAAIMMWNPPWVLTLVLPFGLLPFRAAYGLWALAHVGLMLASAELLWRGFAPADPAGRARHARLRWVAYAVALSFVPTTYLIGIGQLTAVVLAGLAGFLVFSRGGRPLLAGMAAAVTAAKPHLLTLFAAWMLAEVLCSRAGRRTLAGGALVGVAACLVTTLVNPGVWGHYYRAITAPADADHISVTNWATPVIASWVRVALPGQPFWVQLVPPVLAVAGFAVWYLAGGRPRGPRARAELLPWVVAGSLLVAPYGAWPFDLVLLLVPILASAARVARAPAPAAVAAGVAWLAAVNAALLAMMLARASSEMYVWVTPATILGVVFVSRLAPRPAPVPSPVAEDRSEGWGEIAGISRHGF